MSQCLIYLASPYSHADTAIRDERFAIVCKEAARLMSEGHLIYSPIAHTHPIAMAGNLPTGWDFWERYDHALLDACGELWVLTIDGWRESKGVTGEIAYMESLGRPVRYIEPEATPFVPLGQLQSHFDMERKGSVFIVEFRHPHFGWLDYEREFTTRQAALDWSRTQGSAYPIRVREIQSPAGEPR